MPGYLTHDYALHVWPHILLSSIMARLPGYRLVATLDRTIGSDRNYTRPQMNNGGRPASEAARALISDQG